MLRVTNTENLTGVTISGDFNDLYQLVDALHEITNNDFGEELHKSSRRYVNISLRVGVRNILIEDTKEWHLRGDQGALWKTFSSQSG